MIRFGNMLAVLFTFAQFRLFYPEHALMHFYVNADILRASQWYLRHIALHCYYTQWWVLCCDVIYFTADIYDQPDTLPLKNWEVHLIWSW